MKNKNEKKKDTKNKSEKNNLIKILNLAYFLILLECEKLKLKFPPIPLFEFCDCCC